MNDLTFMAPGLYGMGSKEKLLNYKVLLVDDDALILASLKRILRNQFRIETALSGGEALKMIEENGPYAVVVSDFQMPGMNGIEFLCRIKKTHPDIVRMMLTGAADLPMAIKAVNQGNIFQIHSKPCAEDTLLKAIQSGIEKYRNFSDKQRQIKKIRKSLAQAGKIQQTLMPKSDPNLDGFDIAGKSISCDETSGDYYDFIYPEEWQQEKIGIVVADVIGHGISSALLMTTARALFRERLLNPGSIASIVSDVNKRLVRDIEALNLFVTMFYSEIDLKEKCFRWVHAGHEPALLYDPSRDAFEFLAGEGLPLGVMEDWDYEESMIEIDSGQMILIGTDGIKEACNSQNVYFGNERLMPIVRHHSHKSAKDILKEVFNTLDDFRFPDERKDDETLVVIKVP